MSKLINITAPQHRCTYGHCPAVYRSEDGKTFTIVGRTEDYRNLPEDASVSDDESIVEISAEIVLSALGVTELVEAAKPFAGVCKYFDDRDTDETWMEFRISAGQVRPLRSIIDRIKGGAA